MLNRGRVCFKSVMYPRRFLTTDGAAKPKSAHSQLYTNTLPAMVPVFLLGSAVYLGLQLTQLKLSHEKYMQEATNRVIALEAEIDALQEERTNENSASVHSLTNDTATSLSRWRW